MTGAPVTTVSWPRVPPPAQDRWPGGWQVRPAGEDLWLQSAGGPLVLLTEDGVRSGHLSGGRTLGAVSAHGAWCLPDPPPQDIAATEDAPPRSHGDLHQLFVAHPERTTTTVLVDAPVHGARSHDGDLYLRVENGRWTRRNLGTPDSWDLVPETAWLRLPADAPLPHQLGLATHGSSAPPDAFPAEADGGRGTGSPWLPRAGDGRANPTPWATGPGSAGAIDWYAGWVGHGHGRTVAVVARHAGTVRDRFQVDLGPGTVRAATATAGWLWVALEQPRLQATYSAPAPVALLRVSADDGLVETVLRPGGVDVTEHCWPLPPEPVDADDHTAFWRDRLTDLEHHWIHPDGSRGPLSAGLSNSRVEVVGSWPDTELHVTFDYAARPGVRLRRTVPLFDELGRPLAPEYAAIHLMETLDTHDIPDHAAPGADHLDV